MCPQKGKTYQHYTPATFMAKHLTAPRQHRNFLLNWMMHFCQKNSLAKMRNFLVKSSRKLDNFICTSIVICHILAIQNS
jgi:hypothetical protein